jgi:uncharacterized protein
MLKKKIASRPDWKRVLKKEYIQSYFSEKNFTGHVALLKILEIREPLTVHYEGEPLCIADKDFIWLQHYPANEYYSVTTVFNPSGEVVQWYIDICESIEVEREEEPWIKDLFLDIVVLPSGKIHRLDEDELLEALVAGVLDEATMIHAQQVADDLILKIGRGDLKLLDMARNHKEMLLKR